MGKAQTFALYVIALVLLADFALEHMRPVLMLALREGEYFEAAKRCHESRSNLADVRKAKDMYDARILPLLEQSAQAGLMECYEKEVIGQSLLAQNVSASALSRVDLAAMNASKASVRYFVTGLSGER
jgi:hypothetical protein